MILYYIILLL